MISRKGGPSNGPDWAALERALGVRFKERALLRQALVHRSFLNEHPKFELDSYERLEYLGDAFLGWVAADELYVRYPAFAEGDLTRARASLVRGRTLAEIATGIGLATYLHLGEGEETIGGRGRDTILAGALEAVVGAVLLDRGQKAARKLVVGWLRERMERLDATGAPRDAKSALQELTQRQGLALPEYEVLEEHGPAHARSFTVRVLVDGVPCGGGTGRRKADAEQAAAGQALAALTE